MRVDVHDSLQDESCPGVPDALHSDNPFLSREWLDAHEVTFPEYPSCIVAARDGDQAAGLLPLRWRDRFTLESLMAGRGDYEGAVFVHDADPAQVSAALLERVESVPRVARIKLRHLEKDASGTKAFLAILQQRGWHCVIRDSDCSYRIDCAGGFEEIYNRLRSSKSRYNLRRAQRQMEERLGPMSVRIASAAEERESTLNHLFRFHLERWDGSKFREEREKTFLRNVSARFADSGCLDLLSIHAGDRCVAATFSFHTATTLYYFNTGYDTSLAEFSPGSILVREVLRRASDLGLSAVDLLRGEEAYKRDWKAKPVGLVSVTAYNPRSFAGRLGGWWAKLKNALP